MTDGISLSPSLIPTIKKAAILVSILIIHLNFTLLLLSSLTPVESKNVKNFRSAALAQDSFPDALTLFIQEWEKTHGVPSNISNPQDSLRNNDGRPKKSNKNKKNSQDEEMQGDDPHASSSSSAVVHPPSWASINRQLLDEENNSWNNRRQHDSDEDEDDEENQHPRGNCTRCQMHGEARARRLEEIRNDILHKLGLKHAPNVTLRELNKIPPLHNILGRYGMLDGEDEHASPTEDERSPLSLDDRMSGDMPRDTDESDFEDFFVNAERSLSFARNPPKGWNIPKELKSQFFEFSPKIMNAHLTRAHLWIHVKRPKTPHHHNNNNNHISNDPVAWIVVYKVVRNSPSDTPSLIHVRAQRVEIPVTEEGSSKGTWVKVEIKKLVSQWFRHPKDNLGLVIHSYDNEGRELLMGHPNDSQDEEIQLPFVEVRVESKSHNRKKRMVGLNCEENSNESRCCRYPLTVDFEEFGWDWIIAPKRYEANFCSGECPNVFLQKYPHTYLVQQANPAGNSGPCCTPRKMSAISMLYFDDNYNIIYGLLPGMVVDRCGCS